MFHKNEQLTRLLALARQLGISDDPALIRMLNRLNIDSGKTDQRLLDTLNLRMTLALIKQGKIPPQAAGFQTFKMEDAFEIPNPEDVAGDIIIGTYTDLETKTDYDEIVVGQRKEALCSHSLAVGKTKSGKTNLAKLRIMQLVERGINVWVLQLRKNEYLDLVERFPQKVWALHWSKMKINPLQSVLKPADNTHQQKVNESTYQQILASILSDAFSAGQRIDGVFLNRVLIPVYQQAKREGRHPTWADALKQAQNILPTKGGRGLNWAQSVENFLELNQGSVGRIFDCQEGFPIEEMTKHSLVIDLEGLIPPVQNFLTELLIKLPMEYFKSREMITSQPRLIIALDEAHRLCQKRREEITGSSGIADVFRESRFVGIGLMVSTHVYEPLSESLKSNVDTQIMLSMTNDKDRQEFARSIGFAPNTKAYELAKRLDTGYGIVKLGGSPHHEPIPIHIPLCNLQQTLPGEQIHSSSETFIKQLKWTPRFETQKTQTQGVDLGQQKRSSQQHRKAQQAADYQSSPQSEAESNWKAVGLTSAQFKYLMHVREHPYLSHQERVKILGSYSEKIPKELVVSKENPNGWLVERHIRLKKRGRAAKFYELSKRAIDFLHAKGYLGDNRRGDGYLHSLYKKRIVPRYFQHLGYQVKIEYRLCDVAVFQTPELAIAVEIVTSKNYDHEWKQAVRDLQNRFAFVMIAVPDEDMMNNIKTFFEQKGKLPVQFRLFKDFALPTKGRDEDV